MVRVTQSAIATAKQNQHMNINFFVTRELDKELPSTASDALVVIVTNKKGSTPDPMSKLVVPTMA